jgi:hypothetical protein
LDGPVAVLGSELDWREFTEGEEGPKNCLILKSVDSSLLK